MVKQLTFIVNTREFRQLVRGLENCLEITTVIENI